MPGPWTTDDLQRMRRRHRVLTVALLLAAAALTVAGWVLGSLRSTMVGVLLILLLPLLVLRQRQALKLWESQMTEPLGDDGLGR